MAPGQRTFTIVPNPMGMQGLQQRAAGESVQSHRPMTSKQAQKLHRQNTRLPRLSRAEQAKVDRELRQQIKDEEDKRKASNKARILREKKKEREQNIIEAKKRKGLPIVDVRPSQGLISRFVRGNGACKKRTTTESALDSDREESPACDPTTDDETHPATAKDGQNLDHEVDAGFRISESISSSAKRRRVSPGVGHDSGPVVVRPSARPPTSNTAISALRILAERSRESSFDVDDPAVEDLLRTQILQEDATSTGNSPVYRDEAQARSVALDHFISPGKENIPPPSQKVISQTCFVNNSPPEKLHRQPPVPRTLLQEVSSDANRPVAPASKAYVAPRPKQMAREAPKPAHTGIKQCMPPPPPSVGRSRRPSDGNTQPKIIPVQVKNALPRTPLGSAQMSCIQTGDLPNSVNTSILPPSTQQFLHLHLADLLPTPSQEQRELHENVPCPPPVPWPKPLLRKPPSRYIPPKPQSAIRASDFQQSRPLPPPPRQVTTIAVPVLQLRQITEPALPFFSTQDLMLSSQDIRDLQDTTETPSKASHNKISVSLSRAVVASKAADASSGGEQHQGNADMSAEAETAAPGGRTEATVQKHSNSAVSTSRPQFTQAPRYALRSSQPRTPGCSASSFARPSHMFRRQSQDVSLNPGLGKQSISQVSVLSRRSLQLSPIAQPVEDENPQAHPPLPASSTASATTQKTSACTSAERTTSLPDAGTPIVAAEPGKQSSHDSLPESATRQPSPSPQKGRFFTASNEQVQLAMEKSKRTHREEQRKREAEQWAREVEERERNAGLVWRETPQSIDVLSMPDGDDDDVYDDEDTVKRGKELEGLAELFDEIESLEEEEMVKAGVPPDCAHPNDMLDDGAFELDADLEEQLLAEFDFVDDKRASDLQHARVSDSTTRQPKTFMASQETDYGDLDVTLEELDGIL